ncbi:hypothetical protein RYX36_003456 [Vicia faba]
MVDIGSTSRKSTRHATPPVFKPTVNMDFDNVDDHVSDDDDKSNYDPLLSQESDDDSILECDDLCPPFSTTDQPDFNNQST